MNILVTGANGFIGQALCERLIADGYQVRGAESREQRAEREERLYLRALKGCWSGISALRLIGLMLYPALRALST